MRKLIENQTIRIDNHHRGDGCPLNWDRVCDDIHLHKIVNESRKKYEFRIPLNSERRFFFDPKMPEYIKMEIEEAFQKPMILQEFSQTLYDVLRNYESTICDAEKAVESLLKISECFGLTNVTKQMFIDVLNECLIEFTEEDKTYFAQMTEKAISIGQNSND